MHARASIAAWLRRPPQRTTVLLCALAVGLIAVAPYVAHTFHPSYRGLTVIRDKDFANYFSRIERVLKGHPEEASNGITPIGSGIEGMQVAGIERTVGTLLRWTGLDAPPLSVIVTGILSPVLFLLFYLLFLRLAFPGRWALSATVVLFAVMFHVLTRVVHPGWSFVPAIAALLSFLSFRERPTLPRAVAAGILLGALPSLYFWSWTFVWAACGSLTALGLLAGGRRDPIVLHWRRTTVLGLTTLVVSFPFFLYAFLLFRNPLYPEVAIRASFLYERTPESWPRSILLSVATLAFLSLFPKEKVAKGYLAVSSLLLGILLAMHQNVLHARILMFSSHFYPHLLIAVAAAGAWVLVHRVPPLQRAIVAGIAAVFLAAGAWDYAGGHWFFIPREANFRHQHLREPIFLLQNGKRDTVLTDADTGRVITAWTDDGIIYTHHARFLLISDRSMAERFCAMELFDPTPSPFRSIYIEYNDVLDSPAMRAKERELVDDACATVRRYPSEYLRKYGVTHLLWNRREEPGWRIEGRAERLGFQVEGSGGGWTLWEKVR